MNCAEHDAALQALGVNLNSMCEALIGGVLRTYHKAGEATVLLVPAENLTSEQRIAQVSEIADFLA